MTRKLAPVLILIGISQLVGCKHCGTRRNCGYPVASTCCSGIEAPMPTAMSYPTMLPYPAATGQLNSTPAPTKAPASAAEPIK